MVHKFCDNRNNPADHGLDLDYKEVMLHRSKSLYNHTSPPVCHSHSNIPHLYSTIHCFNQIRKTPLLAGRSFLTFDCTLVTTLKNQPCRSPRTSAFLPSRSCSP